MLGVTTTYPRLVATLADEFPGRPFLQDVHDRSVTYGAARQLARRWAVLLDSVAQGRGTVATMMPTGIDYATLTLGFAWSAALEVPVNTALRGRTFEHVLRDSQAAGLVIGVRYVEALASIDRSQWPDQVIVVPEDGIEPPALPDGARWLSELPEEPSEVSDPEAAPHDLAWVLYTSGTTGPAKGVMCTWAQTALTATGVFPEGALTGDDVYYTALPMFHVAGRMGPYIAALLGSRCVIRESFSTKDFWDDIRTFGCTTTQLFPAMAQFLLSQPAGPEDTDHQLRNVLLAPVIADHAELSRRFGVRLCTTWNMTETSAPIVSGGFDVTNHASCGRQRPGYELRIVDDRDRPVRIGEVGELVVRSSEPHALMAGYLRRPEATVEAWRDLWFHTGDAFRIDEDGNYYYVDRRKDALRRRGENISSFEVESDVASHPEVAQAAAIGVPAPDGEQEVMVFVVLTEGAELDEAGLIEYLRGVMPAFMVPRYVEFVDALPQTATFRVQKHLLRERGVGSRTWDRYAHVPRDGAAGRSGKEEVSTC